MKHWSLLKPCRMCRTFRTAIAWQPLDALSNHRVVAFCGIGNPAGFRHTLAAAGCEPVAWREFPDHHAFTTADQADLIALAQSSKADTLVCTQKDLVKLPQQEL